MGKKKKNKGVKQIHPNQLFVRQVVKMAIKEDFDAFGEQLAIEITQRVRDNVLASMDKTMVQLEALIKYLTKTVKGFSEAGYDETRLELLDERAGVTRVDRPLKDGDFARITLWVKAKLKDTGEYPQEYGELAIPMSIPKLNTEPYRLNSEYEAPLVGLGAGEEKEIELNDTMTKVRIDRVCEYPEESKPDEDTKAAS